MIKELEIQKEIEKTLNTNLEEEILKVKNEISIIEIKILRAWKKYDNKMNFFSNIIKRKKININNLL